MNLNETQLDLLKETFNLGVGQAAASLSELAGGEEIILSVPVVEFKSLKDLEASVREQSGEQLCGVSESFSGPFTGSAMMLYSEEESLELVKIMLGETIPVEEMSEMEGEALCEVGNIVLNAVISAIADLFGEEIATEIPQLHTGSAGDVLGVSLGHNQESQVLHLRMDFAMAAHRLTGHIGFFMDAQAVDMLAAHLEAYFRSILES